ncbi:MAG: gamma-glutamyltranspeptidase/glutathione hydrolase [Planctomycetota bacterium]|jgi:gamma-glutamyltranspeptidase/glutathione hydrolase
MKLYTRPIIVILAFLLFTNCSTTPSSDEPTAQPTHGMVVTANQLSSDVGLQVLKDGGNAIDAAIAAGFALAVTHPQAGNIGGGGFMVIRLPDGKATTFDFREVGPQATTSEMFLDESGAYSATRHHSSHLAVGVPGTVAGFDALHKAHGTMPWSRLLAPAVRLARDGFPVTKRLSDSLKNALTGRMKNYPASVDAFSDGGRPYETGEIFKQPDLAATLERIQNQGRAGFYEGKTAGLIVDEMRNGGGIITSADLENYRVKERKPVRGTYREFEVIGMPPPSSGGCCVVEMLNILEAFDLRVIKHNSPKYVHLLTEAMRQAFRDRARFIADADFVAVPLSKLTSKDYAKSIQDELTLTRAGISEPSQIMQDFESDETTHYSVVDKNGTGVAVTYTLEYSYGSGIVVPGAGFILNNEMGDFNAQVGNTDERGLIGTKPNLAAPRKRMLSSMSPTLLVRDGKLFAVIGSPGGRTIINTVLQVALNLMAFDMPIEEAVRAPRFHHQWLPNVIRFEKRGLSHALEEELKRMGHTIVTSKVQGMAHCIQVDQKTGHLSGAADARDLDAHASGY